MRAVVHSERGGEWMSEWVTLSWMIDENWQAMQEAMKNEIMKNECKQSWRAIPEEWMQVMRHIQHAENERRTQRCQYAYICFLVIEESRAVHGIALPPPARLHFIHKQSSKKRSRAVHRML